MVVAIVLFLITYIGLLSFPKFRAYIALGSAFLFVLLGYMPIGDVVHAINWNVILLIAGTMGIVALFIDSHMPALLADVLLDKAPNVKWATVFLSLLSGSISAFIDNVATVLMLAPIAVSVAHKLKINPVPSVIAIAVASNLQGAATLVGDTTSMLLAAAAQMDFLDFFYFQGRVGLFFIVQAGMLAATLFLIFHFRKRTEPVSSHHRTPVQDFVPTYLLVGVVLSLILASFIPNKPEVTNGLICMSLFFVGLVGNFMRYRKREHLVRAIKEIDYFTLLLLAGLFVVIGAIQNAGVINAASAWFRGLSGGNVFLAYTMVVWISVLLSAVIDNIPYVATMLPVMTALSGALGLETPHVLYFGLLIGATLGGNLTPIGASANIAAIGILRKAGHAVTLGAFTQVGLPYTLSAVVVGYLLVWLIWH